MGVAGFMRQGMHGTNVSTVRGSCGRACSGAGTAAAAQGSAAARRGAVSACTSTISRPDALCCRSITTCHRANNLNAESAIANAAKLHHYLMPFVCFLQRRQVCTWDHGIIFGSFAMWYISSRQPTSPTVNSAVAARQSSSRISPCPPLLPRPPRDST